MTPLDRAGAMVTPHAAMDPLERALSYPYEAPAHSYLFRGGEAVRAVIGPSEREGRIPVLACGSNRAPAQLKCKFAAAPEALIPVERVFLDDFDSVLAAGFDSPLDSDFLLSLLDDESLAGLSAEAAFLYDSLR